MTLAAIRRINKWLKNWVKKHHLSAPHLTTPSMMNLLVMKTNRIEVIPTNTNSTLQETLNLTGLRQAKNSNLEITILTSLLPWWEVMPWIKKRYLGNNSKPANTISNSSLMKSKKRKLLPRMKNCRTNLKRDHLMFTKTKSNISTMTLEAHWGKK
jgi:hypothetical protein